MELALIGSKPADGNMPTLEPSFCGSEGSEVNLISSFQLEQLKLCVDCRSVTLDLLL